MGQSCTSGLYILPLISTAAIQGRSYSHFRSIQSFDVSEYKYLTNLELSGPKTLTFPMCVYVCCDLKYLTIIGTVYI
jgi:hypothetical protein